MFRRRLSCINLAKLLESEKVKSSILKDSEEKEGYIFAQLKDSQELVEKWERLKSSSSSSESVRSEVSKSLLSYPNDSDVDGAGESMDTMYDSSDLKKRSLSESSLCIDDDEKPKREKRISRCFAMYPDMVDEEVRFNTFKNTWPRSLHQRSDKLAAAGFFYSCVKFNFCFSSLINFVFNRCKTR